MSFESALETLELPGLNERVRAAVISASFAVMNESRPAEDFDSYYNARAELAYSLITNNGVQYQPFMWAVALNPSIQSAGEGASDNDIEFVVSSVWDAVAHQTASQKPPA